MKRAKQNRIIILIILLVFIVTVVVAIGLSRAEKSEDIILRVIDSNGLVSEERVNLKAVSGNNDNGKYFVTLPDKANSLYVSKYYRSQDGTYSDVEVDQNLTNEMIVNEEFVNQTIANEEIANQEALNDQIANEELVNSEVSNIEDNEAFSNFDVQNSSNIENEDTNTEKIINSSGLEELNPRRQYIFN